MLRIKLGTCRRYAVAVAEDAQVFLQRADAGVADRLIFDLLIPHIRCLAAAIAGFGHLLQHRKAFIAASGLEQELGQRALQLRIARAAGVNFLQLINGDATAGRIFRHNIPVFRRHVTARRITVKKLVIGRDGLLSMPRCSQ